MQHSIVLILCINAIALCCGGSLKRTFYDLNKADELFQVYVKDYNKTYDAVEYKTRLEVFTESLKRYNQMNLYDGAVYGVDQFSDYTMEEHRTRLSCFVLNDDKDSQCTNENFEPSGTPPETLDYRTNNLVTEVKNQAQCNSCYAFSSVGAIEASYAKKSGQLISLSPQQIVDCGPSDEGCKPGGDMMVALSYAMNGIQSDADYPYAGVQQNCTYDANKAITKVSACSILDFKNEEDIKSALVKYGPLSIGLDWTDVPGYKGGIKEKCQFNRLNHGVLLVGYGKEDDKPYWIIKNSWGENWGENGYLRLKIGENLCGIGKYVLSATV